MNELRWPLTIWRSILICNAILFILVLAALARNEARSPVGTVCGLARFHTSGRVTLSNRYCIPRAIFVSMWTCPDFESVRITPEGFKPDEERCHLQRYPY